MGIKTKPIRNWVVKDIKFPYDPDLAVTVRQGKSRNDIVWQLADRWGISFHEASDRFIISIQKEATDGNETQASN